jgi:hypothetical protein
MSDLVACICEGSAEKAIIEILLDNNMLIFTYDDVIDKTMPILSGRYRCATTFESELLTKDYGGKSIAVYYIHDKATENFKISRKYRKLIRYTSCVTRPEVEMLYIISIGEYGEYKRKYSNIKPSSYVKNILKKSNVKDYLFVKKHFSNLALLLESLIYYKNHCSNAYSTIADLLNMSIATKILNSGGKINVN